MSDQARPIPDGYSGVIAYLVIRGASEAVEFYKNVFDAQVRMMLKTPDGAIGHAELQIGGGLLMLADEVPEMDIKAPPTIGGSATGLMMYVEDVDTVFEAAIAAGATQFKPVCDQFYGDRAGTLDDPFGHRWTLASRVENVTTDEIVSRFEELYGDE